MMAAGPQSSDRDYQARIVEVVGPEGGEGNDTDFTYVAEAVNTKDKVVIGPVAPYKRLFIGSPSMKIRAAEVGDDCVIQIRGSGARLMYVPEQYFIAPCKTSTTIPA